MMDIFKLKKLGLFAGGVLFGMCHEDSIYCTGER